MRVEAIPLSSSPLLRLLLAIELRQRLRGARVAEVGGAPEEPPRSEAASAAEA